MDFVEVFNISLGLCNIYYANFSGCWASFVYCCQSILEFWNQFSEVKLTTRSFCSIFWLHYRTGLFNMFRLGGGGGGGAAGADALPLLSSLSADLLQQNFA